MGWMGDANVYALAGSYNANTYQFLRQWLDTVRASQGEDGMTTHTSPNYPSYDAETGEVNISGMSFGITWNSAIVFIPYFLYEQYGDTSILNENMGAIYKYMENLEANPLTYGAEDAKTEEAALTSQTGFLCDHLSVVTTDGQMLGNAMYTWALNVVSQMASATGNTEKQRSTVQCMMQQKKHGTAFILMQKPENPALLTEQSFIHRHPMHLL